MLTADKPKKVAEEKPAEKPAEKPKQPENAQPKPKED